MLQLVTLILLLPAVWEMNPNEKRDLLEVAMQAVGRVLDDQQNRMFSNGAPRPDRFPSDAFPNWVQWKLHFVAVAKTNRWTQIQAINALPLCISGNALDEFHAASAELKQHVNGEPVPTLQALFEYLDRALGVLRNDRRARSEFEALAQKEGESLRDFARRVRNTGMLVYANINAEQRDERFRELFIERLSNPDLLEVLLREDNRTFMETVDRAVASENIAESLLSGPNKRVDAIRMTQEAGTMNSVSEMNKMKQQLKRLTDEMNSLTDMTTQFVNTVTPVQFIGASRSKKPVRCYVCGLEGHIARVCLRRNHLH